MEALTRKYMDRLAQAIDAIRKRAAQEKYDN